MDNTVQVGNQKRESLKALMVAWVILLVCFVIAVVMACGFIFDNFNGEVASIEGTIVKLELNEDEDESEFPDLILEDGTHIDTSYVEPIDWQPYVGQTATFVVPFSQFASSGNVRWLLGMTVDGQTVIDSDVTIAQNRKENTIVAVVTGVLAGLVLAVAIVSIVLFRRMPKTKAVELALAMRDTLGRQQPGCKQGKTIALVAAWAMILAVLLLVVGCLLMDLDTIPFGVRVALVAVGFGLWVLSMIAVCVIVHLKGKKEIEFYAQNYPFDSTDMSHVPLRKSVKERLQQEAKEERAKYPDRYWDCANDVWANFAADGLYLVDEEEEYILDANEIFGDGIETNVTATCSGRYSYAECNFVAVPVYGKRMCPLFVVIKSRLVDDGRLHKDIHLALDSNLLQTLRKYGVPVEDLDYILENKRQLMLDNCPKAKDTNSMPVIFNGSK